MGKHQLCCKPRSTPCSNSYQLQIWKQTKMHISQNTTSLHLSLTHSCVKHDQNNKSMPKQVEFSYNTTQVDQFFYHSKKGLTCNTQESKPKKHKHDNMQTRNVHQNIWKNLHNQFVCVGVSNHQKWFEMHTTLDYVPQTK
jgi:hypothetical protein